MGSANEASLGNEVAIGVSSSFFSPVALKLKAAVLILLTNDDGIYAPGLAAMQRELAKLGDVYVVAPATEQSGVGHMITYLTPLIVREVFQNERMAGGSDERWGWAVEGSPADCVKIGMAEFCPQRPDLVVSGINAGLNTGINVLYSGTVAAAIEGAFYGVTSIAVSLQYERHFQFERAACLARQIIEQILSAKGPDPQLYNVNIPTAALSSEPRLCVVPMNVARDGDRFEKRQDPFGRPYFWLVGGRAPVFAEHETDISAIVQGRITVTPLGFNMTKQTVLTEMEKWSFHLSPPSESHGG
ncbi:MAG: 5'/3'-nucleotidase SurE [Thermoguttaceae bacterium]|jgi:5'-nucleotidase